MYCEGMFTEFTMRLVLFMPVGYGVPGMGLEAFAYAWLR